MKVKTAFASSALALSLSLIALPAAAVSPHSNWFATRYNTVGSSFVNMSPSGSTFCYLSRTAVVDTDTASEKATCRVTKGAVVWTLEAVLGASSDADVECSAICYNN